MAVVTISRQLGAGGRTLGKKLAKRLGYRYVDKEIIEEVAEKVKVSSAEVRGFEKYGFTGLMEFIDKIVSRDFIIHLITSGHGYLDEKSYVPAVKDIIEHLYLQGNVVIMERGSQYILKGRKKAWHVLLVGDFEHRICAVIDRFHLTRHEAEKALKRADKIRDSFLSLFLDKESHEDPASYDLVLNMNRLSMKKAEEMIVTLISD